jgi:hypothetical protein
LRPIVKKRSAGCSGGDIGAADIGIGDIGVGDIGEFGDWAHVNGSPRTAATQAAMHKLARAQSLFFLDRGMTMFS